MGVDLIALNDSIDKLRARPGLEDDTHIVGLLRCCGASKALAQGKRIHDYVRETGKNTDTFVGNWIIQMYGKCGSLEDAILAFDSLQRKNLFSWNIMLAAYALSGHMSQARILFDKMPQRNLVSWNSMITGYAQSDDPSNAIFYYRAAVQDGLKPDRISFVAALQSCSCAADGDRLHSQALESGMRSDVVIATALVVMYGRCGRVADARLCFERIASPDTVLCNALLTAYAQNKNLEEAERLFEGLRTRDVASFTAMVCGYAQNGELEKAREVFERTPEKNVVSWNAIVGAYAQFGLHAEALELFGRMKRAGTAPNRVTCITVLDVCASLGVIEHGREIETFALANGIISDVVLSNALINMYGKCHSLEDALRAFRRMPVRNVVSWNSLLSAYARNGHCEEAIFCFKAMDLEGIQPNGITFSTFFDACGAASFLSEGKLVHGDLHGTRFRYELPVANALMTMYGSCGCVEDAKTIFWDMEDRNVVSWTGIITAYAQNGHNMKALEMFHLMNLEGVSPNEITFVSVFSACSHGGMSKEGIDYLVYMFRDYGLTPTVDHYVCLVDALGRSGEIKEARKVRGNMPPKADLVAWTSIVGACNYTGELYKETPL